MKKESKSMAYMKEMMAGKKENMSKKHRKAESRGARKSMKGK